MIDAEAAGRDFDAAFRARAPTGLQVRAEDDADAAFLRDLFLAGYSLRDTLPPPMVAQQADFQLAAFRSNFPDAMRGIVVGPGGPIGRIIIDWQEPGASHCADIAVLPSHQRRGVGTALLRAWIEVAETHGLACTLTVEASNPARALYAKLGFLENAGGQSEGSGIAMSRPARR